MNRHTAFAALAALALLTACGQSANQTASAPVAVPAAPAKTETASNDAVPSKGEETFKKVCALCHKTGEAGAPKIGDKSDWGPRIAQGKDTLYAHAMNGFTGQKGMMPAKGGSATLADDDVKAAVDFMASKAQ